MLIAVLDAREVGCLENTRIVWWRYLSSFETRDVSWTVDGVENASSHYGGSSSIGQGPSKSACPSRGHYRRAKCRSWLVEVGDAAGKSYCILGGVLLASVILLLLGVRQTKSGVGSQDQDQQDCVSVSSILGNNMELYLSILRVS